MSIRAQALLPTRCHVKVGRALATLSETIRVFNRKLAGLLMLTSLMSETLLAGGHRPVKALVGQILGLYQLAMVPALGTIRVKPLGLYPQLLSTWVPVLARAIGLAKKYRLILQRPLPLHLRHVPHSNPAKIRCPASLLTSLGLRPLMLPALEHCAKTVWPIRACFQLESPSSVALYASLRTHVQL